MRDGRLVAAPPTLDAVRDHAAAELARLPDRLRALDEAAPYPVEVAPALRRLAAEIDART